MVATRKGLTPHQREVFRRLEGRSRPVVWVTDPETGAEMPIKWRWVPLAEVGSRTALEHLVAKGYAERRELRGPRGGSILEYRPVR